MQINDQGNCKCEKDCNCEIFIANHAFNCLKATHRSGYTRYAATDFIEAMSVMLMKCVNIASLDAKHKMKFMANLT